jgi:hypothetical protein
MKHIFEVPKIGKNGEPAKDKDGNIITERYLYDFEKLGVIRVLEARKLFSLSAKEFDLAPKTLEDVELLSSRQLESRAFATILMRLDANGEPEIYNSNKILDTLQAMNYISGTDQAQKIWECQDHFFTKTGLQSPELMTQSMGIIKQFADVATGLKDIEGETLTNMKDLIGMTASILAGLNSQQKSNTEQNFTQ